MKNLAHNILHENNRNYLLPNRRRLNMVGRATSKGGLAIEWTDVRNWEFGNNIHCLL